MLATILSILEFVLVLGALAMIHELGHFLMAKLTRTEVAEFGLGMPPRAWKIFRWQGTDFTLNWIPFGAFVRFQVPAGVNEAQADMLEGRRPWQKLLILSAGSFFNLLVGFLLCIVLVSRVGTPVLNQVALMAVAADSPAAQVQLQAGDLITTMNGTPIDGMEKFQLLISQNKGLPVTLAVLRQGESQEVTLTPRQNPPPGEGALGVVIGNPYRPSAGQEVLRDAGLVSLSVIEQIASLPVKYLAGEKFEGRLVGFKGMFDLFDRARVNEQAHALAEEAAASSPIATEPPGSEFQILQFVILLAFGLGITNLFPFPALDGGRIVFVLIALIFRKPVPPRIEIAIHSFGFIFLMLLMGYITVMDFLNPIF